MLFYFLPDLSKAKHLEHVLHRWKLNSDTLQHLNQYLTSSLGLLMRGTEYISKKTFLGNLSIKTVLKWSVKNCLCVALNIQVKRHFWETNP